MTGLFIFSGVVTGAFPSSPDRIKPVKTEYLILADDNIDADLLISQNSQYRFKKVDFKTIQENVTYLFRLDFKDELKKHQEMVLKNPDVSNCFQNILQALNFPHPL